MEFDSVPMNGYLKAEQVRKRFTGGHNGEKHGARNIRSESGFQEGTVRKNGRKQKAYEKTSRETALVVSQHDNINQATSCINLKWQGNHGIADFNLKRLGKVVSCETETDNTGWVSCDHHYWPMRKYFEGKGMAVPVSPPCF
jgi:hypothetical protein